MNRLQLEIFLGTIFVSITAIALIIYGLNEENRMARFAQAQQADAIEVGGYLYENNCALCHGTRGEGVPGLCPPLNDNYFFTERLGDVGWAGTLEDYIVATISSGRVTSTRPDQYAGQGIPAMPAWSEHYGGPMRLDQIRAIAAFVMNWEATALGQVVLPDMPTPAPPPDRVDDPAFFGQRVFIDYGCGGCHAIEGLTAGVVGPDLTHIATVAEGRTPDQDAEEYIHESILFPSAYVVEGYDDIMPKIFGDQLSDDELEQLVAFLLEQE
jgi:mono/diheme cytochrome c family protein